MYINNMRTGRMTAAARKSIVPTEEAAAAERSIYYASVCACVCMRAHVYVYTDGRLFIQ